MNNKRLLTVATFALAGTLGAFGGSALNGRELSGWRVRHADLVKGGEQCFFME